MTIPSTVHCHGCDAHGCPGVKPDDPTPPVAIVHSCFDVADAMVAVEKHVSAFIREAAGVRERRDAEWQKAIEPMLMFAQGAGDAPILPETLGETLRAVRQMYDLQKESAEQRLAEAEALLKRYRLAVAQLVDVADQYEALPINDDPERLLIYAMDLPRLFDVGPYEKANPTTLSEPETKETP